MYTLMNRISQCNPELKGSGLKPVVQKSVGVLEIDDVIALTSQISAMQNMINNHFSNIALGQQTSQVNAVHKTPTWCEICGGSDHIADTCGASPDSVKFVGNEQRGGGQQNHGNTYNPSWCNHPNFSWGGNQSQVQGQNPYRLQGNTQGYQGQMKREQPNRQSGNMSVEEMLKKIMADQAQLVSHVRNNQLDTQNLEKKFG